MSDTFLPPALDYVANPEASPARMNQASAHIDQRLRAVEAKRADIDAEIAQLQAIGLQRIDDALQPMFAVEQARIAGGVLIGQSETTAIVAVGQVLQFQLDQAQWLSFSPSTFVSLTRKANLTDGAVLRTVTFDASKGLYTGAVIAAQGAPGPFADWELSSTAGSVTAVLQALAQALAARDAIVAAAAVVAQEAAAVAAINARFTVAAGPPIGGQDGDIWFQI